MTCGRIIGATGSSRCSASRTLIATVRASNAAEVVKLASEFPVLAVARWGEVRGTRSEEMGTSAHVRTVPATRMKADRERRVPLCRRALDILDAARTFGAGAGPLVFTLGDGDMLDEKVLRRRLSRQRDR